MTDQFQSLTIFDRAREAGRLAGDRHIDVYETGKTRERMMHAFIRWLHSNAPQTEAMYRQFATGYDVRNDTWALGNDD